MDGHSASSENHVIIDFAGTILCHEKCSSQNIYCEPCHYVNNTAKRNCNGFCVECTEYLCQECACNHKKNKTTRNHVVLQSEDIPQDISPFMQLKNVSKCETHTDRIVDFQCVNHNKIICSLCLLKDHRNCSNINELTATEQCLQFDIESVLETVQRIATDVELIIDQMGQYNTHLEKTSTDISRLCDVYVMSVKGQIDRITMEVKSKVENAIMSERRTLEISYTEFKQFEQEVGKLHTLEQISKTFGKDIDKIVTVKHIQEEKERIRTFMKNTDLHKFTTCPVTVRSVLFCIQSLCKITSKSSDNFNFVLSTTTSTAPQEGKTDLNPSPAKTSRLELCSFLNVKSADDKLPCHFIASAFLPGNRIAILDAANDTIKFLILHKELFLYMEYDLFDKPSDMCVVVTFEGEVYLFVCFPQKKIVQKLQVKAKRKCEVLKTIKTNVRPISISSFKEQLVTLSTAYDDNLCTLEAMTCSDTTAKQFCKEPNIQFAKRIRFVNQTSLVLLAYTSISCVQLSNKGTDLRIVGELWHIDTAVAGVIDISDVVVGDGGCMYVSGSNSNNVKLLKTNGEWGIHPIIYFVKKPTSISLNNIKQTIIVSCDDNTVRVFAEQKDTFI